MKKKKKLLVGIFVDFMGAGDETPEDEIKYIKDQVKDWLGDKYNFMFVSSLNLCELISKNLDLFIVDYGGVLPGAGELVGSMMRGINDYAVEHPSCLLVLWTTFTTNEYKNEMGYTEENVIGNSIEGFNILIKDEIHIKELWKEIKERLK